MSFGFARAFAVLAFAHAAALGAAAKAAEPASSVRLFGSSENANADISPFPKWTGALQRYQTEQHLEDAPCAGGRCELQHWKAFVAALRGHDRMRQLQAVNAYANRIPYRSDLDRYGATDHWATPREALGRSADCEDYAIVKYLSLRKLGWPPRALRLVVLQHELRNEVHAVLIAYANGTAYVLDNLIPDVREHAAIRHYRPIFSINETAWHLHREWNPDSATVAATAAPARVPAARSVQVAGRVPHQSAAEPSILENRATPGGLVGSRGKRD